jgi:hypothetical protein
LLDTWLSCYCWAMFYNLVMIWFCPSESEGGVDTKRLSLSLLAGFWSALFIAVLGVEANNLF